MEIIKNQIDELNAQIQIQLNEADLNPKVEASLADIRKKAQIKGFRPGKVPVGLIKKMYGKAVMYEEMNKFVSEALSKYLKDENIETIGEPIPSENQDVIDLDTQKEFNFSFDLGLRPEFEIELNKKLKIPYYSIQVDNEMIEKQINTFADRYGKIMPIDSVSEKAYIKGHLAEIDETGNLIENGLTNEESSISVNSIKDEETKQEFLGKLRGDMVVIDPKKAYSSDSEISILLGIEKDQVPAIASKFQFTIKEITEYVKSEIDQELFDKVFPESGITSVDEFENKIKDMIAASTAKESDYKFLLDTREKLIEKSKIALPEEFLKRWIKIRDDKNEFSDEKLNEEFPKLIHNIKWQLIVAKIGKDNELKVEQDEVKDLAIELTEIQFHQYYGLPLGTFPKDQLEKYAQDLFLKKEDEVRKLYDRKYEEKVVAVVKESVKLDEKEVSVEDFNKLFSEN
jgi:trigger factor